MKLRVDNINFLDKLTQRVFPDLKMELKHGSQKFTKDKLLDFLSKWPHVDEILKLNEEDFIEEYALWAKKKEYQPIAKKAIIIYGLAKDSIPSRLLEISTVKIEILNCIQCLQNLNMILTDILSQMLEIISDLEEFEILLDFCGISDKLAVQLIAEIGDVTKFRNGKCLIAYAGIDPSPFESGNFSSTKRKISKRGNAKLRKVGYQAKKCMMSAKNEEKNLSVYVEERKRMKTKKSL